MLDGCVPLTKLRLEQWTNTASDVSGFVLLSPNALTHAWLRHASL
jgi:hypothetical protein